MFKITYPRTAYDGTTWWQHDIEGWFKRTFLQEIKDRIDGLSSKYAGNSKATQTLNFLKNEKYLERLLLLEPLNMSRVVSMMNRFAPPMLGANNKSTLFAQDILDAFGYENYRKNKLAELAGMLNVKTCPYCNHQYTLYIEKPRVRVPEKLAKLQFDHFMSKKKYPYLSMSLYNLIPSCGVCNQGKSQTDLDVKFNPYVNDIGSTFSFRVEDKSPANVFAGGVITDNIKLKLENRNIGLLTDEEIKAFDNEFNISIQYGRHRDVIQEIFDKSYLQTYFDEPDNFTFLHGNYLSMRLLLGTYEETKDIEKRPMTKFIQDIWQQITATS